MRGAHKVWRVTAVRVAPRPLRYCASDMRGYVGTDNRHYLLNFHRGMPPEDPSATHFLPPAERGMSIFWRFLRPEFVNR